MSFNGYYQCMCKNGHLWEEGINYEEGPWIEESLPMPECVCDEPALFKHLVDNTHGDEWGRIEFFKVDSEHFFFQDMLIPIHRYVVPMPGQQFDTTHKPTWDSERIPTGERKILIPIPIE